MVLSSAFVMWNVDPIGSHVDLNILQMGLKRQTIIWGFPKKVVPNNHGFSY